MAREVPALRNDWAKVAPLREPNTHLLNVPLEFFSSEEFGWLKGPPLDAGVGM